jgi:3-isopropylmalate/(R)-2-methylmalate dehydratase small subunit
VDGVEPGDQVTIDFAAGQVTTPKGSFSFPPLPPEVLQILEAGGLVAYVRKQLGIG